MMRCKWIFVECSLSFCGRNYHSVLSARGQKPGSVTAIVIYTSVMCASMQKSRMRFENMCPLQNHNSSRDVHAFSTGHWKNTFYTHHKDMGEEEEDRATGPVNAECGGFQRLKCNTNPVLFAHMCTHFFFFFFYKGWNKISCELLLAWYPLCQNSI